MGGHPNLTFSADRSVAAGDLRAGGIEEREQMRMLENADLLLLSPPAEGKLHLPLGMIPLRLAFLVLTT